jgi:VanZ family protein
VVDPTAGRSVARLLLLWLPVAAWAAFIFFLSSKSEPPEPTGLAGLPGWSWAAHFGLYFVLGAFLYNAFKGTGFGVQGAGTSSGHRVRGTGNGKLTLTSPYLLAFAAGALYAATDEVHQYFVPMRQTDVLDWLVDIAGVLVGALAVFLRERRRGKT